MIDYQKNIKKRELTIYDKIDPADRELYIPTKELEKILRKELIGFSVEGLKNRTRSKVIKMEICKSLGYKIPKSFKKTRPRFLGQNFDVYGQKKGNVQIWNEDISPERRYVFTKIGEDGIISSIKVITGEELAVYDRTRKLTQKYQARMKRGIESFCSERDTKKVRQWTGNEVKSLNKTSPLSLPEEGKMLSIQEIYSRLFPLTGEKINYIDADQERNRGAELHKKICERLGYSTYEDDGQYPDITNQLLEIKLQTSATIDLGLHSPTDDVCAVQTDEVEFKCRDIRYAIFKGKVQEGKVLLTELYVVTGKDFENYFPLFKNVNKKIQIPVPSNFFD